MDGLQHNRMKVWVFVHFYLLATWLMVTLVCRLQLSLTTQLFIHSFCEGMVINQSTHTTELLQCVNKIIDNADRIMTEGNTIQAGYRHTT